MDTRHPHSGAGFTLLEVLIILAIIGLLVSTSVLLLPDVVRAAKADSGSSQLLSALRAAREQAITERRNFVVSFVGTDRLRVQREELGVDGSGNIIVTGQTVVSTTALDQGVEFLRFAPGVPDTPDGFSPGVAAVSFTGNAPWRFTSEGTLVSQSGDVVNGTVFLGRANDPTSARAITLFGATALLREWKWSGAAWFE